MLLLLAFVCVASVWVGKTLEEDSNNRRQIEQHRALLQEVLVSDTLAFADIEIVEYSGGTAFLVGSVESNESLERLRMGVARQFGENLANRMTRAVTVVEDTQKMKR
ncbi:MAG: hypothetical protein ABI614_26925 [Planctomycetota bacterium]